MDLAEAAHEVALDAQPEPSVSEIYGSDLGPGSGAGAEFEEVHGWQNPEDTKIPGGLPEPTLWRVLIMPVQPRRKSKGGIILVDATQDSEAHLTYLGKIVALGPIAGKKDEFRDALSKTPEVYHWDFKVGDWVMFGRHGGQRIEFKGVKLVMIADDEIMAKLPNGPEGYRIYI